MAGIGSALAAVVFVTYSVTLRMCVAEAAVAALEQKEDRESKRELEQKDRESKRELEQIKRDSEKNLKAAEATAAVELVKKQLA